MFDRNRTVGDVLARRTAGTSRKPRDHRPLVESLEGRALLATLATIPDVQIPQFLGYQLPLDGNGNAHPQTFTVTSSNPAITPTIAQGQFFTIHVTHTSSGANDPAFSGDLVLQLFGDLTPNTVAHITTLVNQGFYNNKVFHRVASGFPNATGFIVQGGSVSGTGTGDVNQPGFPFNDEFNQQLAFTGKALSTDPNSIYSVAGQLAMANSGADTNSSQFFITTSDPQSLDFKYTLFGQLVAGQQILTDMTNVARNGETPINPITMTATSLSNTNPDGVVHISATNAAAGQTATITVTATDTVDHTTATHSFTVTTTANPNTQQPFLGNIQDQVVGSISATQGQTSVFQLPFVNPNGPGGSVAFRVAGGVSNGAFTPVSNATATVDANGVVKVVPNASFTGVISLVVGVRNASATDTPTSYDLQNITLTVNSGAVVNLPPIATPGTATAVQDTPTTVQLAGNTANPNSSQTLAFTLVGSPSHGTISSFNSQTGTFIYTPNSGFQGTDVVQFRVTDVGAPTPNLDSTVAAETITVGGGVTGAVRLIDKVLVVTPPPRFDSVPNTIQVTLNGGKIQVFVNQMLDSIQPTPASLDRIVVFGTKSGDRITVDPAVTVPTTLDGGHGGLNTIQGGGAPTSIHTWFGRNTVTTGTGGSYVVGRAGRFRVISNSNSDLAFAGVPKRAATLHNRGAKPGGTFFKFTNGRAQAIPTPKAGWPKSKSKG